MVAGEMVGDEREGAWEITREVVGMGERGGAWEGGEVAVAARAISRGGLGWCGAAAGIFLTCR